MFSKLEAHDITKPLNFSAASGLCFNSLGISSLTELDFTLLIFNGGATIQLQEARIPLHSFYFGIGLFNLVQLQYGRSSDHKFRIKYDLLILSDSPIWKINPKAKKDKLALNLNYELNFNQSNLNI